MSKQDAGFNEFWTAYPRKVGKIAARKAWIRALREASPIFIIHAVRHYPFDLSENKRFVPHPSRWLNEGRWLDEPESPEREELTPDGVDIRDLEALDNVAE